MYIDTQLIHTCDLLVTAIMCNRCAAVVTVIAFGRCCGVVRSNAFPKFTGNFILSAHYNNYAYLMIVLGPFIIISPFPLKECL